MSETKWMPGPYRVEDLPMGYEVVAGEVVLADCWDEAEAHLFAAAPDLYEALALALPWLETRSNDETVTAVRAALVKARGEEP